MEADVNNVIGAGFNSESLLAEIQQIPKERDSPQVVSEYFTIHTTERLSEDLSHISRNSSCCNKRMQR
jgi:hypothetical protein